MGMGLGRMRAATMESKVSVRLRGRVTGANKERGRKNKERRFSYQFGITDSSRFRNFFYPPIRVIHNEN